jgi:hypothetical protein
MGFAERSMFPNFKMRFNSADLVCIKKIIILRILNVTSKCRGSLLKLFKQTQNVLVNIQHVFKRGFYSSSRDTRGVVRALLSLTHLQVDVADQKKII